MALLLGSAIWCSIALEAICASILFYIGIEFGRRSRQPRWSHVWQRSCILTILLAIGLLGALAVLAILFQIDSTQGTETALRDCSIFYSFELVSFLLVFGLFYGFVRRAAKAPMMHGKLLTAPRATRELSLRAVAFSLLPPLTMGKYLTDRAHSDEPLGKNDVTSVITRSGSLRTKSRTARRILAPYLPALLLMHFNCKQLVRSARLLVAPVRWSVLRRVCS